MPLFALARPYTPRPLELSLSKEPPKVVPLFAFARPNTPRPLVLALSKRPPKVVPVGAIASPKTPRPAVLWLLKRPPKLVPAAADASPKTPRPLALSLVPETPVPAVAEPDTPTPPLLAVFVPLMMCEKAAEPLSVSGLGTDCMNAEEFMPSSRSALRFATSPAAATEKGESAAVKEGATPKVLAPLKVWAVLSRATLVESRRSASVPEAMLPALRSVSPVPGPVKVPVNRLAGLLSVLAPVKVWALLSRATLVESRRSLSAPALRLAAF